MEKQQIIDIKIDDMLDDGRAFGRYDGCAIFVSGGCSMDAEADAACKGVRASGAVPGDVVKVRIDKVKKSAAEASLVGIVSPSPDRIKAECPYAAECGGCTMQELSYNAQKRLKAEQVRSKLKRLGGLEDPVVRDMIGADTLKYYRNKAVFAVGPHGEVGFKKAKSHFVMDIDDCMLQTDAAMVCADALRTFLRENPGVQKGTQPITGFTVRTAFGTGEVMAVLETGDDSAWGGGTARSGKKGKKNKAPQSSAADIQGIETLVEMLDDAVYSLNNEDYSEAANEESAEPDVAFRYSLESVALIHNGKCRIVAGKPTVTESFVMDDGRSLDFEISPQSFYQVNPEQMERLYDKAAEYVLDHYGECKQIILDLYCGAGTIGIWLLEMLRNRGDKSFENTQVIGIETVKPAVLDANRNSVINGLINTRYICGKAEEELPGMMGLTKLYKWNEVNERVEREPEIHIEKADVAILDPPRAGCDTLLLDAVIKSSPERIVYVSCDPGTLARDIRYLTANGYEFIECTPVDQFPWTSSIECVSLLKLMIRDKV